MDYREAIKRLLDKVTDQQALIRIYKFIVGLCAK